MVGVVAVPADAAMEGPVLVLVVSEAEGGAGPRPEETSTMPGSLVTLAQGRALKYTRIEVSTGISEKGKGRSHLNATIETKESYPTLVSRSKEA